MLPLMRTAWIINRRLLVQFSPVLVLYLGMLVKAQCSGEAVQMATVLVAFSLVITLIVTFQGLLLPVEDFILALPVSRGQVVRAKYLSSLLGLAAGLALPCLTAAAAHLLAPSRVAPLGPDTLGIAGLAGLHIAFGIFLFLPFVYRFGPAKGLSYFALTLAVSLAGVVTWKGRSACTGALVAFCSRILEHGTFALGFTLSVAAFGVASVLFSTWAYKRRAASSR